MCVCSAQKVQRKNSFENSKGNSSFSFMEIDIEEIGSRMVVELMLGKVEIFLFLINSYFIESRLTSRSCEKGQI